MRPLFAGLSCLDGLQGILSCLLKFNEDGQLKVRLDGMVEAGCPDVVDPCPLGQHSVTRMAGAGPNPAGDNTDFQSTPYPSSGYRSEQMDDATIAAINAMMSDPLERIWHDR